MRHYNLHNLDGDVFAVVAYNGKFKQNLALAIKEEYDIEGEVEVEYIDDDLEDLNYQETICLEFECEAWAGMSYLSKAFLYE